MRTTGSSDAERGHFESQQQLFHSATDLVTDRPDLFGGRIGKVLQLPVFVVLRRPREEHFPQNCCSELTNVHPGDSPGDVSIAGARTSLRRSCSSNWGVQSHPSMSADLAFFPPPSAQIRPRRPKTRDEHRDGASKIDPSFVWQNATPEGPSRAAIPGSLPVMMTTATAISTSPIMRRFARRSAPCAAASLGPTQMTPLDVPAQSKKVTDLNRRFDSL